MRADLLFHLDNLLGPSVIDILLGFHSEIHLVQVLLLAHMEYILELYFLEVLQE